MQAPVHAFLTGLVIGIVPGVLCKLASGLAARLPYTSKEQRQLAARASVTTCGGAYQPLQYLVGCAMIARGEFAFLVAYLASKMVTPDGVRTYTGASSTPC